MRRGYIQPSQHNQQAFSDEKKRKEKSSTNLRDQERKPASVVSSSHNGAKEKESPETKKLERKTTDEDINASADAFIKNFRQQLLIQRLQSIENYEQMLARGL